MLHLVTGRVQGTVEDHNMWASCGPVIRAPGEWPLAICDYLALRKPLFPFQAKVKDEPSTDLVSVFINIVRGWDDWGEDKGSAVSLEDPYHLIKVPNSTVSWWVFK